MVQRNVRGWGLAALTVGVVMFGSVGMRPGTAHAANASMGAANAPNRFSPTSQTINVGDTLTFVWQSSGANGHNAVGGFTTAVMTQAALTSAAWMAATPGTYYFYCSIHAQVANATEAGWAANTQMVGKLIVVASGAPAPAPIPPLAAPVPAAAPAAGAAPGAAPAAAQPAPAKTGNVGLVGAAEGNANAAMGLGALALLTVAGARFATRRTR